MLKIFKPTFLFLFFFLVISFSNQAQEEKEPKKVQTEGEITETKLIPLTNEALEWKLGFYGFVKSDYVYSNHSVLSYGRENLVAPNQAKRHVQRDDSHARSNIQLGDTRLGFKSEYGKLLTGVIEMDFIDFDKSSPNVNVRPRLRQAYIVANLSPEWEIFAGQKWDIFSPLNPDTYNVINNLFYIGNVGWMREQIGTTYKFSKDLQFSLALGNSSVNTSAASTISLEKNRNPSLAAQIKWAYNSQNTFFLSAIRTDRTYSNPDIDPIVTEGKPLVYDGSEDSYIFASQVGKSNRIRRDAMGISLGSEFKAEHGKFTLKWEGNWGKNLSDLNVLGIGQAQVQTLDNHFLASPFGVLTDSNPSGLANPNYAHSFRKYNQNRTEVVSIEEVGLWMSTIYKWNPKWELGVFWGITKISNPQDLSPAFSDPKKGTLRDFSKAQGEPVTGIWSSGQLGRIRENGEFGYHLTYLFASKLKLFFQHEYIRTFYQDPERNKGMIAHIKSIDLTTGTITLQEVRPAYLYASSVANSHILRVGVMMPF